MSTENNTQIIPASATDVIELKLPTSAELAAKAAEIRNAADILLILDDESLAAAKSDYDRMKKEAKEIDDFRKSVTRPLDEKKKAVMALFNPVTDAYKTTMQAFKIGMANYAAEQERKVAKQRAEAEAKAAEEKKLLEAKAAAADDEGQREALKVAAALVTAEPVAAAKPAVKGVSQRKTWKAEITDLPAFLKAAIERPELLAVIEVNEGKLNKLLNASGGTMEVPGMTKRQDTTVVIR